MPLMVLLTDWAWPRKESVSLKKCQYKLQKCNARRKKIKAEQNVQELWDNYKWCNIHMLRISEKEERKEQKKYLSNNG